MNMYLKKTHTKNPQKPQDYTLNNERFCRVMCILNILLFITYNSKYRLSSVIPVHVYFYA